METLKVDHKEIILMMVSLCVHVYTCVCMCALSTQTHILHTQTP